MDKSFPAVPLHISEELQALAEQVIEASYWSATPLTEVAEIVLTHWQVMQLPHGDRHFVGWNVTEHEGRASSKIVEFDAATRQGRTHSGRIYKLRGYAGHDGDAAYTWGRWMQANGIVDSSDVSAAVQALIDAGQLYQRRIATSVALRGDIS